MSAQGIVAACIVWNLQSECTRPGWCMYAVEFTVWVHKTWLVHVCCGIYSLGAQDLVGVCILWSSHGIGSRHGCCSAFQPLSILIDQRHHVALGLVFGGRT